MLLFIVVFSMVLVYFYFITQTRLYGQKFTVTARIIFNNQDPQQATTLKCQHLVTVNLHKHRYAQKGKTHHRNTLQMNWKVN